MGIDPTSQHKVDLSPKVADEVTCTTCYMCACRCGIKVHLIDGKIRYIEGNQLHPVNKGALCAKGAAGIMQQYSPARLRKPLKRIGPRGAGEFVEIEWEEALNLAVTWLRPIRESNPRKLAFFTGRDQSQALTGWWASQFGTPNYAAHGGFCSVNMATAGIYSIGGSFWEFGEPDWDKTRYFMMFGVAEDHGSNPIKAGISKIKSRGAKFVSINPVRTGYSAVADEWIGIRPGTDGLFVLALVHELMRAGKVDIDYLRRYTNAGWLVVNNPGGPLDGLFARDEEGVPLCWDKERNHPAKITEKVVTSELRGNFELESGASVRPVFQILAERYLDKVYSPDSVAPRTGIDPDVIRRIAAELVNAAFEEEIALETEWTDSFGRRHEKIIGRPVSMHAMRGISAHSNGFHTCRAIHLLQMLLGTVDTPGGFLYKPPFPKMAPPGPLPAGKSHQVTPGQPMNGPPLGFPSGPEDLLVDDTGEPQRIDKAFSWEAPLACHGMMHSVISNAKEGDPYPIDVLFMYMANMAWNSSMNTAETIDMLTARDEDSGVYKIPKFIYSDAYFSETVAYADLVLPDTTYLERWDCISLLDRPICSSKSVADSIRQPVLKPDRDVRPFQDVLIDLGFRLGLPGLTTENGKPRYPGGYPDYMVNHQRKPGIGSLAGWRGINGKEYGSGSPNPDQLKRYIENQCFWEIQLDPDMQYYRHANSRYLDFATEMSFVDAPDQVVLQLYSEPLQKFRLAAQGFGRQQPPEVHRSRIAKYFDPLPIWYQPFEQDNHEVADFPMHALSQRPMAMYHSWGSQNAWLRQIYTANRLYLPKSFAESARIINDDWVWVISRHNRIKCQVRIMAGVNEHTVWTWNAIGKRRGAWNLTTNAPEASDGFLLNHLIDDKIKCGVENYEYANADPVTGQAAWFDLRVRIERVDEEEEKTSAPQFDVLKPLPGSEKPPKILRYGESFRKDLK